MCLSYVSMWLSRFILNITLATITIISFGDYSLTNFLEAYRLLAVKDIELISCLVMGSDESSLQHRTCFGRAQCRVGHMDDAGVCHRFDGNLISWLHLFKARFAISLESDSSAAVFWNLFTRRFGNQSRAIQRQIRMEWQKPKRCDVYRANKVTRLSRKTLVTVLMRRFCASVTMTSVLPTIDKKKMTE